MTTINSIRVPYDTFPKSKTAIHTSLTPRDKFADAAGWHSTSMSFEHGKEVDTVTVVTANHEHTFAINGVLSVRNIVGHDLIWARIDRIRMMDTEQFTQADFDALAFADSAEYEQGWGAVLSGRVWMFDITPIDPDQPNV